jgi:hypothetical protein
VNSIHHSPLRSFVIDLHGMHRWKAKKAIIRGIFSLMAQGKLSLLVIHGYHHGTILRDYIRNGRFLRDLHQEYPLLPPVKIIEHQPGATKIRILRRCYHAS